MKRLPSLMDSLLVCMCAAVPLSGSPGLFLAALEHCPKLGGYAFVLNDGRGGLLTSNSSVLDAGVSFFRKKNNFNSNYDEKCTEREGDMGQGRVECKLSGSQSKIWSHSIWMRKVKRTAHTWPFCYLFIYFINGSGEVVLFALDDLTGSLLLSHSMQLSPQQYPGKRKKRKNSSQLFLSFQTLPFVLDQSTAWRGVQTDWPYSLVGVEGVTQFGARSERCSSAP